MPPAGWKKLLNQCPDNISVGVSGCIDQFFNLLLEVRWSPPNTVDELGCCCEAINPSVQLSEHVGQENANGLQCKDIS